MKSHNKGWLRILKKEDAAIRQNTPVITNKSINDPNAWDASWFGNYE
ncbi:MAG TPA: hypothetical protein VM935_06325 [Chitinophagaceae bacterium]|nr:hypothetical protein [Chitinophagaceae bacterium]